MASRIISLHYMQMSTIRPAPFKAIPHIMISSTMDFNVANIASSARIVDDIVDDMAGP